ncbi:MAG TPA: hypothetical protein VFI53_07495 [Myxococcaceae bacterium]|nr:hypothetical protein [Myxococcaceae bacterium]
MRMQLRSWAWVGALALGLSGYVQWLKVKVDPRSREVFNYQPQIVPANRVAVPPP